MTRGDQPTRWFRVQPIGYVWRPDAPEPDPGRSTIPGPRPRSNPASLGGRARRHRGVQPPSSSSGSTAPGRSLTDTCRRARGAAGGGTVATLLPRAGRIRSASAHRLLRRAGRTLWVSGIDAWPSRRFSISSAMRHATICDRTQPFRTGWKPSGQRTTRSEVDDGILRHHPSSTASSGSAGRSDWRWRR